MNDGSPQWYRVYVRCTSTERFDVLATSKEDALARYENGDATLEADEVESREVTDVNRSEGSASICRDSGADPRSETLASR